MTRAFAAFGVDSPLTQAAAPFVMGQVFKQGEVPVGYYCVSDLPNVVVTPLCYWNDGSLKMARVAGRAPVTGGTTKQINLLKTVTQPAPGALMTESAIATAVAAAGAISADFSGIGTVNLSSLLGHGQTLLSTREMVEVYYHAPVGNDASLYVEFYVRAFVDGRMYVNIPWNNAYLGGSANADKTFVPTITIGGVVVYNNGGAPVTNSQWAGANWDGWIGGDPQTVATPDTAYMQATKLVPNKGQTAVTDPILSYLNSINTYTPYSRCGYTQTMGQTGYQDQIGVLSRWDSLYLVTRGHRAAHDAVIANARAIYGYAISYADPVTRAPIKLDDYATWSLYGPNQGGADGQATVTGSVEYAHHPEAGIFAYMITSDFYFLRAAIFMAKWCYLCNDINSGNGTMRYARGQNRARAWFERTLSFAAAFVPTFMADQQDLRIWQKNVALHQAASYKNDSSSPAYFLGLEDMFNSRDNGSGSTSYPGGPTVAGMGGFEADFNSAAWGQAVYLQPCDDTGMAAVLAFAKYLLQFQAGRLGGTGPTEFNFGYCVSNIDVSFRIDVPTTDTFEPVVHGRFRATDWGQVWEDTFRTSTSDTSVNPTTNVLTGLSGAQPTDATGYYGNLMMPVSVGVDIEHDFNITIGTGMQAGFNRLINASNYASTQGVATYDQIAQFADRPRSDYQQTPTFAPVGSNSDPDPVPVTSAPTTPTPGPSFVWDSAPLVAPGVWDVYRGLGIPASDRAVAGSQPGLITPKVGDPAGSEYRNEMLTAVTGGGTLTLFNNGAFTYQGADGTHTATRRVWTNGAYEDGPIQLIIGTASPVDTQPPVMVGTLVQGVITPTSIATSWQAALDDVGVVGYKASQDGGATYIDIGLTTGHVFSPLTPFTVYALRIEGYDQAGNVATVPLAASIKTLAAADTQRPTQIGTLGESHTSSAITIDWSALMAFDDTGVVGRSYRIGGSGPYTNATVGEESLHLHTFIGLAAATVYLIDLVARDAAGNYSDPVSLIITTSPAVQLATVCRISLGNRNGAIQANLTNLDWAFFDQIRPSAMSAPSSKGSGESTDSSGLLSIDITGTTLAPGAVGWLVVSNSNGDPTQPNQVAYTGPVFVN